MTTNKKDGFDNFDFFSNNNGNNNKNNNLVDREVVDAVKAFESEDSLAKLHNGELKDQFLTLKTAALMNRDHHAATSTSTMSLKNQLVRSRRMNAHKSTITTRQVNVANLFVDNYGSSSSNNKNSNHHEEQQEQEQDEESCVDLHGQFEADDDLEEQLLCAHMLEKIKQRESKLDDTESVTTATASLSSADESGRSGVPTRKVLTLDSIVGDTGETMRLEKASLSSRSRHSKSRHSRNTNSSSNLRAGDNDFDEEDGAEEEFASEGIPTERRRNSRGNSGRFGTGHRNRSMAAEMDYSESQVRNLNNSQIIMDQSEIRIGARRRASVTGSTGGESNMGRSGRVERRTSISTSTSERRGASDRRANISGRGRRTIPSDDLLDGEQAPHTPRRAGHRIRDRARSTGGRHSMASDLDERECLAPAPGGSTTPRARRTMPERPNSMELRRVTRDPARRGRRATIGTDILKRNLQILDQYEDESENPDDDLAFDANFGDDMDMSLQVQDLGKKTEVWKQRRQRCGESTSALSCGGSELERVTRRGSILAATAALSSSNRTAHSSTSNLNMSQSNVNSLPGLRRTSTSSSVQSGDIPGLRRTTSASGQSDVPVLRRTSTSTPISQRRLRSRGAPM